MATAVGDGSRPVTARRASWCFPLGYWIWFCGVKKNSGEMNNKKEKKNRDRACRSELNEMVAARLDGLENCTVAGMMLRHCWLLTWLVGDGQLQNALPSETEDFTYTSVKQLLPGNQTFTSLSYSLSHTLAMKEWYCHHLPWWFSKEQNMIAFLTRLLLRHITQHPHSNHSLAQSVKDLHIVLNRILNYFD